MDSLPRLCRKTVWGAGVGGRIGGGGTDHQYGQGQQQPALGGSEWISCVLLSSPHFLSGPSAQLACRWERVDSHWHLGLPYGRDPREGLAALVCPIKSSLGVEPAVIGCFQLLIWMCECVW